MNEFQNIFIWSRFNLNLIISESGQIVKKPIPRSQLFAAAREERFPGIPSLTVLTVHSAESPPSTLLYDYTDGGTNTVLIFHLSTGEKSLLTSNS